MPDFDGFRLAEAIHDIAKKYSPTIILLTPVQPEVEPVEDLGNIPFHRLTKPPRMSKVYELVTNSESTDTLLDWRGKKIEKNISAFQDSLSGRILLAEDNTVNQEVAIGTLKLFGCHVDLTTNGNEAVRLWEKNFYDVILMDLQMPVLDGYQATKAIRRAEAGAGRRTPIIALTAHALQGDDRTCLDAGMDAYQTKPFNNMELHACLKKWLSQCEASNRASGSQPTDIQES